MSTNPAEVQDAIRGRKLSKAPGRDCVLNKALKLLPQRMILLLVELFNAILRMQYFPPVWKHSRVISILKPGKNPPLPSSYRPINLLNTIGKVFEKILLCRILSEVRGVGYCVMNSLVSDQNIAHPCSWPACLSFQKPWREAAHRRGFRCCGQGIRNRMGRRPCLQVHGHQHPLLPGENLTILPAKSDLRSVLPSVYVPPPWHAGWCDTRGIDFPCPL
jgi:hypothetical protein